MREGSRNMLRVHPKYSQTPRWKKLSKRAESPIFCFYVNRSFDRLLCSSIYITKVLWEGIIRVEDFAGVVYLRKIDYRYYDQRTWGFIYTRRSNQSEYLDI
jgi:hypothetical protein